MARRSTPETPPAVASGPVLSAGQCAALFAILSAANPEPRTELEFHGAFELLVAVILSAQATDRSVNKATRGLFLAANTPCAMAALGAEGIIPHIHSIGLFNSKARHIAETSRRLCDHFQGQVPTDRASLEALPGVGRKTANVVLNVAFGQPTLAVDTHIFRVANRTGLAAGRTPLEVELQLLGIIPEHYLLHAHHWLILHGRYQCTARQPRCLDCTIRAWCRTGWALSQGG